MPYAYTLSGSIREFENNEWTTYWKGTEGLCTTPNSNTGYYIVTPPSGTVLSSTPNTTSYLLTIYHGINNFFYFESEEIKMPKTVYLYVNHSSNNVYLHYYKKIYRSDSTYLFASPYQKYPIKIDPDSTSGIFDLHAYRKQIRPFEYDNSYGHLNVLPFTNLNYNDAEDGKIYNLEISKCEYNHYDVENIPNFTWDPSFNIISFHANKYIIDDIYYDGIKLERDIHIKNYSIMEGYIRFHLYLNSVLQTSPIDKNKVKFSKSFKKYTLNVPSAYIDTTPLAEDYYAYKGSSYTYILPDNYIMKE